ncbi:MAG: NAD(P)H-dependent oxidoreductase [Thermoflexales bacterium]|nr:NAD(P)H-dependent oxidoreductase [Thermoflexales bacterium]
MYILAINGSPRGRRSNTDRILQPFLEGARAAGAQTETVYLADLKINPCLGCFTCWTKTPGVCVHKDDMADLLPKLRRADVVVYATPLYVFTVSGLMKDFMDRHLPNLDPHIVRRGEHFLHPPRHDDGPALQKIVLISNCGFPERAHFSGLVETFRCFTVNPDTELAATILCAGGELLAQEALRESLRWYTDAARRAGEELVRYGRVLPETQAVLDTPLAEPEVYANMANLWWDSQIGASARRPAGGKGEAPPPPEDSLSPPVLLPAGGPGQGPRTCREAVLGMATVFNPAAAGDLRADIQFVVAGEEPGHYVLRIRDGRCTAHEGTVSRPTLTIHTPADVWLKIARNELSGQAAYVKGMYRVEGDFGLLLRLGSLFSGPEGPQAPPEPVAPSPPPEETVQRGPIRLPGMAWLTVAFIPWIVHWATMDIPDVGPWVSLGGPLLLGALIWGYRQLFARPTWMETGTPLYFALAGLATLLGSRFFTDYGDVLGYLTLAGIWLGTLAAERPFTAEYSKWSYPPALWNLPVFLRTNAIITTAWGWVYLLMAALALAGHARPEQALLWVVVRNLLLIPAFAFTAWFQKWYPARG